MTGIFCECFGTRIFWGRYIEPQTAVKCKDGYMLNPIDCLALSRCHPANVRRILEPIRVVADLTKKRLQNGYGASRQRWCVGGVE